MQKHGQTDNWHDKAFFGLAYDLHSQARDTELGASVTHDLLRSAWQRIKPDSVTCDCKGHAGYTSYPTKVGYPSPGIVRDALRIHRDVTKELGIPLVMHYSGIYDEVSMEHHPDWRRINAEGKDESPYACPRSGYLTELVIPQMLELIDEYDVDGFWVDGDIWVTKPCYCQRCISSFVDEYDSQFAAVPRKPAHPGWKEWLVFQRNSYEDYVRAYVEAVHQRKPGCLVCTNWLYSVRHPDDVTIPVDYLSGDFSSVWGLERATAEARFLDSRGMTWDLIAWTKVRTDYGFEPKTTEHLCQEASEVIANGGGLWLYINPQRSGHLVSWQHDIVAEVAQFVRARQSVSMGSSSVPQTAVLHGQTRYYANTPPLYGYNQVSYAESEYPVEGAMHALLDSGYHVDIENEQGLLKRLDEYSLVVVPEQDPLSNDVATVLTGYVERGGQLVLSGSHVAQHPVLSALAGVEPDNTDFSVHTDSLGYNYAQPDAEEGELPLDFHHLPVDGEAVLVSGPWQPVHLARAQEWLPLLSGQEPSRDRLGTPAVTLRKLGQGSVAAVHGPIFASYYRTRYPRLGRLLSGLFRELWKTPTVEVEATGSVVHTLRRQGDRTIIHLLNRSADPPTSPSKVIVEQVPSVGPVVVKFRQRERPISVQLVPKEKATIQWDWSDGLLTIRLSQLGIHSALVVEATKDQ